MDPSSAAFTPRDDIWRMQTDMSRLTQIQQEHADRLNRLERRQDDDARTKSIWGSSSPFPGVLAGTPQQRPVEPPPADAFSGFDDQSANLIGSLHLDAEDEPRRVGATSRANSVRFDETANQGHWSHPNRSSLDLLPRSASSLGSHPMMERTFSHKSDGRQSSAGHSVHSAASRANSLGIDTLHGLGASDVPALSPGLLLLGACPAMIRCWLTTKFKHDSLRYAAVCTGSFTSFIPSSVVLQLGLSSQVLYDGEVEKLKLKVYLPEAVVRSASTRSDSPTPQLPFVSVDFTVTPPWSNETDKSVAIILGSDALRAHRADVLFSSNNLIIYDDNQSKLSIPLVRPEDDSIFKVLRTTAGDYVSQSEVKFTQQPELLSGLLISDAIPSDSQSDLEPHSLQPEQTYHLKEVPGAENNASRNSLSSGSPTINTGLSIHEPNAAQTSTGSVSRSTNPSAIWNNWRRDSDKPAGDESGLNKPQSNYQRREQGIKVLRPLKSSSRAASGSTMISSPASSQSRFFEDGKRRSSTDTTESTGLKKITTSNSTIKDRSTPKSANPVGSGSAFSWLSK